MSLETIFKVVSALGGISIIGALYKRYTRPTFESSVYTQPQEHTPIPGTKDFWDESAWVRIGLINKKGCRPATQCRPFIVGVQYERADGSVFALMGETEKRAIPWQNDVYEIKPRDCYPGVLNAIDVAYTHDREARLCTPAIPTFGREEPGIYRFAILVESPDAPAERLFVKVTWDGRWKSLTAIKSTLGQWVESPR